MSDIQSAAQWIGRLLAEEVQYLSKVEDKVKELQDELEWMQCFLREADAKQFDNAMARKWVDRIRELAYEAEDTIEKYLVRVVPRSRGKHDFFSLMRTYSYVASKLGSLHTIGKRIDDLKEKMSALSSKLHTYGIKLGFDGSSSLGPLKVRDGSSSPPREEEIVGRDFDIEALVDKLVSTGESSSSSSPSVVAICGDAGVGKTFLAKRIFNDPEIRKKFKAFAWANVSNPCRTSSVQQDVLSSLTMKSCQQIAQMTDDELQEGLHRALQRRDSFIVIDGVFDEVVWEKLRTAFPTSPSNRFPTKILVTTRLDHRQLGDGVDAYTLEPLQEDFCRQLLDRKVKAVVAQIYSTECRTSTNLSPENSKHNDGKSMYPGYRAKLVSLEVFKMYMEEWQEEMLGHCKGLPLPIVVLGGVLATKKTVEEWENVKKRIGSLAAELEAERPRRDSWKAVLEVSYYELPFQIKPCFLFLGYFPTNLEIPAKKITRLWEAEGLVSSGDDEMSEESLQEIAEHCLSELVERSLVQVVSRGLTQKPKTCLLHDSIQELCISKATKVNWLNIVQYPLPTSDSTSSSSSPSPSSSSSSASRAPKSSRSAKRKYRRLAIYCSATLDKLPREYRYSKNIRSLLFFNTLEGEDVLMHIKKEALRRTFTDYKLLRVLDIEKIEVSSLTGAVGHLAHLRYLSLNGSWVTRLPWSIQNLRCLQTLDLRVLPFVRLRIPDVLHKLERLVHLYLPPHSFILRDGGRELRLEGLRNLETLSNFSKTCRARDLEGLKRLRKFSSCDFLSGEEGKSIELILGVLTAPSSHLERVSLKLDAKVLRKQPNILENCQQLRRLWVKGEIGGYIEPIKFLENGHLIHISLCDSKFEHDPMAVLGTLPHLRRLSLENASYEGDRMCCPKDGFKELTQLALDGLKRLREWEVEEGAMPKLLRLAINNCRELRGIPEGLVHVRSLQEVAISYMPLRFFKGWIPTRPRAEWPEHHKVPHVPSITISYVMQD